MAAGDSISLNLTREEVWREQGLNVPILSSAQVGWRGLEFAYHRQPAHEIPVHSHTQHVIAICVQPYTVNFKVNGQWKTEHYICGDTLIFPAYESSPFAYCDRTVEFINLFLDPTTLTQFSHQLSDTKDVEVIQKFKVHDPLIYQIGLALKTELKMGGADSGLYAESMANALSAHMLQRYSAKSLRFQNHTDSLSKSRLRQAIAYIHDHLDQDLRLADIAATVHLSSHYFACLFKQSVGLAPHQYVTQCRIERAKQLLAKPELTITEILEQVGFKSQSHFTRLFRQYTSTTPKAYRDEL